MVFYAGHGSMRRDKNGDEPDGLDETLMLHDARSDGVRDLVDDEFHEMLQQLHAKTENITVVLDSCNAGTATRGDAGTFVARFFEPADEGLTAAAASAGQVDLAWTDVATTETGYKIERCTGSGCSTWAQIGRAGVDANSYNDLTTSENTT